MGRGIGSQLRVCKTRGYQKLKIRFFTFFGGGGWEGGGLKLGKYCNLTVNLCGFS